MDPIFAVCLANMAVFFALGIYVLFLAQQQKTIQNKLEHLEQLHDPDK